MRASQHPITTLGQSISTKVDTMTQGKFNLSGWGYEGKSIDDLTEYLVSAGPIAVVDIRLNPISRKKGFSKRALAAAIIDSGSQYLHLPALGNPKDNREGFQHPGSTSYASAIQHFRDHVLATPEAHQAMDEVLDILPTTPVLLLCFERSSACCHRTPVIDALISRKLDRLEVESVGRPTTSFGIEDTKD